MTATAMTTMAAVEIDGDGGEDEGGCGLTAIFGGCCLQQMDLSIASDGVFCGRLMVLLQLDCVFFLLQLDVLAAANLHFCCRLMLLQQIAFLLQIVVAAVAIVYAAVSSFASEIPMDFISLMRLSLAM